MEKIYNKLVRDNIPEIIKQDKAEPQTRILEQEEYLKELFKKLEEEAKEAVEAMADRQELMKEIGDIYEIIDAIIDNCGLDKEEIMKLKNERKIERGGFEKKIFLISSELKE
ncbi:nucleoside triphosphate pyrophosphohydrolase [Patescibacteria group bacterium]|nr:nucleoside triphosphate pyrophosphohydrolase [Patescibacteria group bacterium]